MMGYCVLLPEELNRRLNKFRCVVAGLTAEVVAVVPAAAAAGTEVVCLKRAGPTNPWEERTSVVPTVNIVQTVGFILAFDLLQFFDEVA